MRTNAANYEQFSQIRNKFGYQLGCLMACNHILAVESQLLQCQINCRSGHLTVAVSYFNRNPREPNPYAVRLSRNVTKYLGRVNINARILPALVATADSMTSEDSCMKAYLLNLYSFL